MPTVPILYSVRQVQIRSIGGRCNEGGEDLRPVVEVLAVGIGAANEESMPEVMRELNLSALVLGGRAVDARE